VYYDGSEFVGIYVEGKKKGKGKYTWSDSSAFNGDFDND
jgi:stalled ribosome alternative rescue factor ArfA